MQVRICPHSSTPAKGSILRTVFPDIRDCVEHVLTAWVPFMVVAFLSPFLIYRLRRKARSALPFTRLLLLRWAVAVLLVLASLSITVCLVFMSLEGVKVGEGDLVTSFLILISMGSNTWYSVDVAYTVYFSTLMLLWFLSFFADRRFDDPTQRIENQCPESAVSFPNLLFFHYFGRIAWRGWKHGLKNEDLWILRRCDSVAWLRSVWERHWNSASAHSLRFKRQQDSIGHRNADNKETAEQVAFISKASKKSGQKLPSVIWVIFLCFKWPILLALFLKTVADVMEFSKPQLLRRIIAFMELPEFPFSYGVFFTVLLFVISVLYSLLLHQYFHIMFRLGMNAKSMLMSAVFEKALLLSNEARKGTTVGEIVNLMSVDVQRIVDVCPFFLLVWSAPLEIIMAIGFLWEIIGVSVFVGVAVMVLMIPINFLLTHRLRQCQIRQMKFKDVRMKMINEILNGIKVLKLHAWELAFKEKVLKIRKKELRVLRQAAIYGSLVTLTWTMAPLLVAVVSFATYVLIDSSNRLTPEVAFVSLALFNLLRFPMTMLPMLIVYIMQASVSNKRLKKFFAAEEVDATVVQKLQNPDYAISFRNATFSWDKESEEATTLRELNLDIPRGKCVAIIGRVGAGKSSVCSAILGEMHKLEGSVAVQGTISYVPQQAWILNATVRDNILFTKPNRPSFYTQVVKACSLDVDIEEMSEKSDTEIGEKGINLSGGQKQRLSIARAVYQSTDIYLFDDPLSAVDSRVGRHIFDNVIGRKGLLKDKTRVFVTHALAFLKDVDLIVIMDQGRIKKVGTPSQLMSQWDGLSEFLEEKKDNEEEPKLTDLRKITSGETRPSARNSLRESNVIANGPAKSHENEWNTKRKRLIEEETAETGRVKTHVYKLYVQSIGFLSSFVVFILYMVSGGLSVGSSIWLAEWSEDSVCSMRNRTDCVQTDTRIGVYAALGIGQALFVFVAALLMMLCMVTSSANLHERLLHNLLRVPMSFYETTPLGRVLNRIGKDIDVVDNTLPAAVRTWMNCLVQIAATLVIIAMNMKAFAAAIIPLGIFYYAVQRFYVSSSRQLKRMESVSRSPIYSLFQEVIQGAISIRAYRAQKHFRDMFDKHVDANQMTYYPMIVSNRWLAVRLESIGNLLVFFAAIFAVYNREEGILSAGMVGLAVTYALSITQTLNWVVRMTSDLETNIVSVERIVEYMNVPTEADWTTEYRPPPNWPSVGRVEFDRYAMRYRPGLDLVLKGISFVAHGGEKVGIVGRTGAGKSSITLALFRIVEPVEGSVVIDNVDISLIGLHDLRSRISIIPQEPVLFCGSIRMNIDPTGQKNDDEIWTALEHAHLKSFVSTLPDKLDHEVVEGGENLSRILILDEATAAVDHETDQLIQGTIREFFAQCTVLTIAHRLNTVMDSDKLLVLSNGQVIDNDSPANLLSRLDGEIAWRGWRRGVQKEDLWLLLPKDTVEELRQKWENLWKTKSQRFLNAQHHRKLSISYDNKRVSMSLGAAVHKVKRKAPSVFITLVQCFKWQALTSILVRTLSDVFEFMKPQVLRNLIQYMEIKELSLGYGIFFSVMLLLIGIFQSLLLQTYYVTMSRVGMNLKSILMSAIFEKALRLSSDSRRETTAGEMINMMSADIERILHVCPYLLLVWSAPLEVILALVFLWRYLGPSVFAGLAVMVLMIPINFALSSFELKCQHMALKDRRMKMMSEVLNGIKICHNIRMDCGAPTVVSFAAFLLSDPSNELTPEVAFVSLSLFNILHLPISLIPIVVAYSIHAYVSLKRLSTFLNLEELDESIVLRTEGLQHMKDIKKCTMSSFCVSIANAISFERATFSWEADNMSGAVLRNINLKVTRGACIAVIGKVGCGKSSLCSAILGEMYKVDGSITVSGSIAYVPQQAWILNATVKNNVLFYSPERSEFYKKVVRACGLDADIRKMPKRDETEIGEKGSNLSGGQKQRLSLARAVYQDADIYILDDPLSAVDSQVGRHIFDHVIGKNGLLKEKTRIFITNALMYLKEVDKVVILEDGEIRKIGTPSGLLKEDLLKQFLKEEIFLDERNAIDSVGNVFRLQSKLSIISTKSLSAATQRTSRAASEQFAIEKLAAQVKIAMVTEEERMKTGRVTWRVYGIYLRSIGTYICLIVLLVYLISAGLTVASNEWLARWSEDALLSKNDSRYVDTNTRIGGYAGFGIAQAFFMFSGALIMAFGMVKASAKLHANLLHSLLRVPMDFYETTPVGRILNRLGKDMDMVDNLLATNIRELLNTVTQVIRTLVIIMINMSVFGVVVIPLAALYVLLQRFYVPTSRQLQRMEAVSRSPIYSLFQEVVHGISSVRAYNAHQWFRKRFDTMINKNQMSYFSKIISNRWLAVRIEFISTIMVFCAAIFAVYNRDTGIMSAGMVGLSITYALTITQVLNWVMEISSFVETNIVSVERIDEYIQLKPEASWKTDFQPPADWPSKGKILFDRYSTRYRPGLDLALKNISFVIYEHEKAGIVGRTGAGKSSMTLALFRIIEPVEGAIYIDDDPVLFFGTLRMNIDPPEEKTDDEIWLALEQANLKLFVRSLPEELDFEVSEGGENLSVGQRQMICLARALLRKSRILVLDEATAAVDLETDELIQDSIRRYFSDCTVLTIAHRLNTVMDSDRMLVLSNGSLIENNSPADLLMDNESEFYSMARESNLI
ncbi:ABC membrane and ABC tran domain containing prote in [Trichuris trichiura]|uniref:ABC-type glutathione-S-conjugate transporter n=1 Tax=Trichuris trichiura TaxID=36087 RepID=A0A077YYV3_TRITR|nr:ABC membrane and ABC tran domain containing prote in [Trichuris trichiura]